MRRLIRQGRQLVKAAVNRTTILSRGPRKVDTTGAAIEVDDYLPGERTVVHDPNLPRMDLGIVYPNMKEFRLTVRQFAINEEFELHIIKIDPTKYIADCKG